MEERKNIKLPENWDEMLYIERVQWLGEHFDTDKENEHGEMIYDTENMSEEVLQGYKDTIEYAREMKKQGYLID